MLARLGRADELAICEHFVDAVGGQDGTKDHERRPQRGRPVSRRRIEFSLRRCGGELLGPFGVAEMKMHPTRDDCELRIGRDFLIGAAEEP